MKPVDILLIPATAVENPDLLPTLAAKFHAADCPVRAWFGSAKAGHWATVGHVAAVEVRDDGLHAQLALTLEDWAERLPRCTIDPHLAYEGGLSNLLTGVRLVGVRLVEKVPSAPV